MANEIIWQQWMWERTPLTSISVSAFCMVVSFVVLQPADENHWLQHVTNASISLAQSKFNECPVFYYSIFVSCQHLLTCIFAISARPTCLRDAVCISDGFQINQKRYRTFPTFLSFPFAAFSVSAFILFGLFRTRGQTDEPLHRHQNENEFAWKTKCENECEMGNRK